MTRTDTFHAKQGVPLITRRRRQLVGHDILLARHGNHICSMRVDRGSGHVVALLDDGSVDSAPNLISPGLRLPETPGTVLRADWKFLTVISAATAGFGGLVFAAMAAVHGMGGDPSMVQALYTYPAY